MNVGRFAVNVGRFCCECRTEDGFAVNVGWFAVNVGRFAVNVGWFCCECRMVLL